MAPGLGPFSRGVYVVDTPKDEYTKFPNSGCEVDRSIGATAVA